MNSIYYLSPFDYPLLVAFAVTVLFVFLALFRRKQLYEQGPAKFYFAAFGSLIFFLIVLWLVLNRVTTPQQQLVVERDYIYCRSWSHREGVPWRYIAGIHLDRAGRLRVDAVLRFDLAAAYVDRLNWGDWVKSQRWVNCQVSGITDNPRRIAWPTNTQEIYNQTLEAWQLGRWR